MKEFQTTRKRILLVDDEPLILEMFSTYLLDNDYDVTLASDAKTAVEIIKQRSFDAVIADMMLDFLNGLEIIKLSRKINSSVIGILITGTPNLDHEKISEQEKVFYLAKPLRLNELLSILKNELVEKVSTKKEYQEDSSLTFIS